MIHTGYIRLRAASLTALQAIMSPRGTEALLDDGTVWVQNEGPTGTEWRQIGHKTISAFTPLEKFAFVPPSAFLPL